MTAFEQFPAASKVWIYAASRKLTPTEQERIKTMGSSFTAGWTAHQLQLRASLFVMDDVFLVLLLDETLNPTSGCGIDKSVAFMKQLEQEFSISLFNRMQVEVMLDDEVFITDKKGVAALYQEGKINDDTMVFNKLVHHKQMLDQSFMIPLHLSWCYPAAKNGLLAD